MAARSERTIWKPWNTSDINYFEKLHDEVICVIPPEEMCGWMKPFFLSDREAAGKRI